MPGAFAASWTSGACNRGLGGKGQVLFGRPKYRARELRYTDVSMYVSIDKDFDARLSTTLEWAAQRTWEAIGLHYVPVQFSVRFAYGLYRAKEKVG